MLLIRRLVHGVALLLALVWVAISAYEVTYHNKALSFPGSGRFMEAVTFTEFAGFGVLGIAATVWLIDRVMLDYAVEHHQQPGE